MQRQALPRQDIINNRLSLVIFGLVGLSLFLVYAVASFQWLPPEVQAEFALRRQFNNSSIERLPAVRGVIYDRDGVPLAFNRREYEIGVSPNLVTDPVDLARELAFILNQNGYEIDEFALLEQISNSASQWELIARPVSAQAGQAIADEDFLAVRINPLSSRAYPQSQLAAQVLGFVIEEDDNTRGAVGIEGFYNEQLAGNPIDQTVSNIPLGLPIDLRSDSQRGMDLVLTIDRDVQYWVEAELERAIIAENASGGTIIVMDPRNGDILAMASYPTFDPNNFIEVQDPNLLRNPVISDVYEPGSVMKVLTVAAALETGAITPDWTYYDEGSIEVGGVTTRNWDRNAYGTVDTAQLLINSLNVGVTTVALRMGPDDFYNGLGRFGMGRSTRVDLPGEESGILRVPGDGGWGESDIAANSYGQAVSVTPLQMITAFAAIANDGLMYQPRLVRQIIDGDEVITSQPSVLSRAVSADTANIVTDIMVRVVQEGATLAQLDGYNIAGKTGTAQIPTPTGYSQNESIASFIGFFPADAPQAVVLIKLDRPQGYWGSRTATTVFRSVAERLVLLLGIPNDTVRRELQAEGGVINAQR